MWTTYHDGGPHVVETLFVFDSREEVGACCTNSVFLNGGPPQCVAPGSRLMPEPKSASRRFYIAPRENRRSTDAKRRAAFVLCLQRMRGRCDGRGLATTPPTPPLPPPPPAIRVRNGCVVAYGQTVSGWRQCCRSGSDQWTAGRPRRPRAAAVASIVRSSSSPPPSRVLLVRTADSGPVSAGVGAVARHTDAVTVRVKWAQMLKKRWHGFLLLLYPHGNRLCTRGRGCP